MRWKLTLALILLFFLVIFTMQNYAVVKIQFLFWSVRMSRAIVIFATLFVGIIIGWIGSLAFNRNKR